MPPRGAPHKPGQGRERPRRRDYKGHFAYVRLRSPSKSNGRHQHAAGYSSTPVATRSEQPTPPSTPFGRSPRLRCRRPAPGKKSRTERRSREPSRFARWLGGSTRWVIYGATFIGRHALFRRHPDPSTSWSYDMPQLVNPVPLSSLSIPDSAQACRHDARSGA